MANPFKYTARLHTYDYDAMGNRKWSNTSDYPDKRDDYAVNEKNQYVSRENVTLALTGTAHNAAKVAVRGLTPVAPGGEMLAERPAGGRHWGTNVTVNNQGIPVSGTVSAYAVLPGQGAGGTDLFRVESKTAFIPPDVQSFQHDADGNLTSDSMFDFVWDAENRLIRATTTMVAATAGRPNLIVEFGYDYLGRRVRKAVRNGATTQLISERRFVYDGWNVVAETDGSGSLKRTFTWGLDISGSLSATGGVGALLHLQDFEASKGMFAASDGNGNIAAMINASSGTIEASYEYSPFGEPFRFTGSYAAANPFRFSSKWHDDETGLIYYGVRYFAPREGRFINRDPIEEEGGLNLYGFCGNDGINGIDYLGFLTKAEREAKKAQRKADRKAARKAQWQAAKALEALKQPITYYRGPVGNYADWNAGGGYMAGLGGIGAWFDDWAPNNAGQKTYWDERWENFQANLATLVHQITTPLRILGQIEDAAFDGLKPVAGVFLGDAGAAAVDGLHRAAIIAPLPIGKTGATARVITAAEMVAVTEARVAVAEFEAFMAARGLAAGREAEKAWEVYQRAKASKGLIIGPKNVVSETVANGMDKLRFEPGWTRDGINKAWLDGAVDARLPVRIVGDLSRIGQKIVAGGTDDLIWEIRYLIGKGYRLEGGMLLPP